jgi:hypothetical protein
MFLHTALAIQCFVCYNLSLLKRHTMTDLYKGYSVIKLNSAPEAPVSSETDREIIERLRERFQILEDMTKAVKAGKVKAMIVSGPPGVGKSFGIEHVLSRHDLYADIAQDPSLKRYEIVKGVTSALGLYQKMYEYSDSKNVLVLDDCDSALTDEESLGLLKGALDSSGPRTIGWHKESRVLRDAGVPNSFSFKGGIIFITNIKFSNIKSSKLKDHIAALESRCHYIDLTIDTEREKMLRIRQIVTDGLLDPYDFSSDEHSMIIDFIDTNRQRFRELSLRTVLKAADLYRSFPDNWQRVASISMMKK